MVNALNIGNSKELYKFMQNKALWYHQFGQPKTVLQLESSLIPQITDSELLVKMHMAPINPSDLIPITGAYSHRITLPLIAGYEGIGTVIKANNPTLIGKRVLPLRTSGTWQNYVICDANWVIEVPEFIRDELACRGYINPLAAYVMLNQCDLKDKKIIITAAGSSCANIIAQWAYQLGAKRVVGIYRSAKHISKLTSLGVIPIAISDYHCITHYALDSHYVFDAVGGDLATLLLQSLSRNAKFLSYGLLSGKMYQIKPDNILPTRFHLRDYLADVTKVQWQDDFKQIWQRLNITQLADIQHFQLTDWRNALDYFDTIGRQTKPVLVMENE